MWVYLMRGVPSLDNLESEKFFKESTVIYDKDENEIYTIFKDGKRTNIPYTEISKSIIDATISTEDRTFFENPGIDILGLVRVGATYVTGGRFGRVGGASTISQQLIKNTLLTNEVTVKRKAQEAYLSYMMNQRYSKEKILEMYLNTISFGHNASGIEQASKTFFGKSAKDVGPLGATILASVINAPTRYSPYMHRDRVMGKLEVYPVSDTADKTIIETLEQKELYAPLYREFKSYLSGMTVERKDFGATICGVRKEYIKEDFPGRSSFLPDDEGCSDIGYESLGDFFGNISFTKTLTIKDIEEEYAIEYTIGRKDFVAKQLLEDNKIDGETYKKIIYDGIDFEFKKYVENIKYPYFVMYVKEYLETKYGKDMDITSGLKVYTTIDPALQEKAEEVVKKQVETNRKLYGASSAALVSMDNTDGKLLAMVGGADYFDTENG
jgi:penicillin-binding protein 1A